PHYLRRLPGFALGAFSFAIEPSCISLSFWLISLLRRCELFIQAVQALRDVRCEFWSVPFVERDRRPDSLPQKPGALLTTGRVPGVNLSLALGGWKQAFQDECKASVRIGARKFIGLNDPIHALLELRL